jgi:hypothetical protein
MRPITFDEAVEQKAKSVPEWVVDVWNQLIAQNFNQGRSSFKQKALVEALMTRWREEDPVSAIEMQARLTLRSEAKPTLAFAHEALDQLWVGRRADIFKTGYCDLEPLYRAAGWRVVHDKPAYNETYDAYFKFTKGG